MNAQFSNLDPKPPSWPAYENGRWVAGGLPAEIVDPLKALDQR